MTFLALVGALLLEQWHPLRAGNRLQVAFARYVNYIAQNLNAGQYRDGVISWVLAVLPVTLVTLAVYLVTRHLSGLLALAWNIAVLYLALGFRQFSHYFTEIQLAVKSGDIDRARSRLEHWRGASGVVRTREEVIRLSIEEALIASHRHVFGVLLWYLLLPGPAGAILYRLAVYFASRWKDLGTFGDFANRVFYVLDWPAVRLTAAAFAVVGDFEDAVYCWRTQARSWFDPNAGIVLAAGAGAMGVRLGMPVQEVDGMQPRPELGVGEPAEGPFLDSTVGLLWRAVVVWVFAVLILTIARLL